MIYSLTRCFTRITRSMSRALITVTLAVLTTLSLSTTTHANVDRVTYLHYDGLGSAIAATDEQGTIQWRENYQPYGQRTKYEATNHSVWFTGKPEEEDFALQYYGGRWYDPNLGRFNSIDPQGFVETSPMSFNRYAYGNNNPYSYVDPDGELPFLVPLAIFLVKEAAAEVASHYTDGWSDFLSVRRMATSGLRHARNALRRGGVDLRENPSENVEVFRVFGSDARAQGFSWTPVDPRSVNNFRDAAGLPSGGASGAINSADFLIKGRVNRVDIIKSRAALPLDGNNGSLPELIIDPSNVELTDFSVLKK